MADQEEEIKSTTSPPEGVTIPEDEIFGGSEQLPPIDQPQKSQTPQQNSPNLPEEETPLQEQSPKTQQTPETQIPQNSIKINGFILLAIIFFLCAGSFFAGQQLSPKPTPQPHQQTQPQNKSQKRTNLILDRGLFLRKNSTTTLDLISARLKIAKQGIFHITDNPSDPLIGSELLKIQKQTGVPVRLLTGAETLKGDIQKARKLGLIVNQLRTTLERPYGILLIDSKLVIDTSRKNWTWETSEPDVIQSTRTWIEELIKDVQD